MENQGKIGDVYRAFCKIAPKASRQGRLAALAEFARGAAMALAEGADEVVGVREAASRGDFLDGEIVVFKEFASDGEAEVIEICHDGLVELLDHGSREISNSNANFDCVCTTPLHSKAGLLMFGGYLSAAPGSPKPQSASCLWRQARPSSRRHGNSPSKSDATAPNCSASNSPALPTAGSPTSRLRVQRNRPIGKEHRGHSVD